MHLSALAKTPFRIIRSMGAAAVHARRDLAVAAAAGIAMAAALPSLNFWPVAFVAMAPFLWRLRQASGPGAAFALGLTFGFAFYYAALFWLHSIHPFAPAAILAVIATAGLALYCALYAAVFAWLGWKMWRAAPRWAPWTLPSLWILGEWVRSVGALAFPWAFLGHTQSANLLYIQMADLGGALLVSFAVVAVNVLLLSAATAFREKRPQAASIALIGAALWLVAPQAYGWSRVNRDWTSDQSLRVAIAQPNVSQPRKFASYANPDEGLARRLVQQIEDAQIEQIHEIGRRYPDAELIVLPETAFTQYYLDQRLRDRIASAARQNGACVFFGVGDAERISEPVDEFRFYVAAWLATPADGVQPRAYRKMRLVPFGESLPYFEYIPFLKDKVLGMGVFNRGVEHTIFECEGLRFGCGICFESASAAHMAQFAVEGAQFLVVITNDGWYYHEYWRLDARGAPQHDALSTFRAIESRRWLVRATNTGISRIIDAAGRTVIRGPRDLKAQFDGTIFGLNGLTLYARLGDWPAAAAALILIAAAAVSRSRKRKRRAD